MPRLQQRITELTRELATATAERAQLTRRLRELDAGQRAQVELQAIGAQPNPLAARVAELEAKLAAVANQPPPDTAAHAREVEALQARIRELEARLQAAERAERTDDLKRIRGIGPAFERALTGLGVTAFAQIASWSADDVDRIAGQLGITPSRISSGRWVEQASEFIAAAPPR